MMNRKWLKLISSSLLIWVVGPGCFRHAYKVGAGADTSKAPEYSQWQHNLFWGLLGGEDVDVKKLCPSGNAYIQNYHSILDMIITSALGGFWSPTTVEVYCGDSSRSESKGKSLKVTLSEDAVRRIAEGARFQQLVDARNPVEGQQFKLALSRTSTAEKLSCR